MAVASWSVAGTAARKAMSRGSPPHLEISARAVDEKEWR